VKKLKGPVLLHVITKKGKGYGPAESEPTKFHGIGRFNIITGETDKKPEIPSYTDVFGQTIVRLAKDDEKIVAITAAMSDGTGLENFAKLFPNRFFDVGIAEGHALTFAAGLACGGMKPVCSIYSTFLQRGLDQIIHDIALQNLPVIMAIDRAGLVGEDGATHHGAFDLSFLRFVPGLTIMAPADENELQHMFKTAFKINGPVAIRYPRGTGIGVTLDKDLKEIEVGKAKIMLEGKDVCILAIGNTVYPAISAAKLLKDKNLSAGVVNMRFLKPIDEAMLTTLLAKYKKFVVIEENAVIGGLSSAISEYFTGKDAQLLKIALPDHFIEHGSQKILRDKYGLTAEKIAENLANWLKL
jgi:1-deoxy-D-xylulose-5-phosphate synthase